MFKNLVNSQSDLSTPKTLLSLSGPGSGWETGAHFNWLKRSSIWELLPTIASIDERKPKYYMHIISTQLISDDDDDRCQIYRRVINQYMRISFEILIKCTQVLQHLKQFLTKYTFGHRLHNLDHDRILIHQQKQIAREIKNPNTQWTVSQIIS